MSTLQFLRERAGVLVAGIIGLSLFIFVVSDFFGNGRGSRMKQRKYYEIGEIGGETVSYLDYEARLQNLIEIYKMSGRNNIDEPTMEGIREQVWQQIVRENILESSYEDLGIDVSSEEVDELVLGNNPHPVVLQLFSDPQTGSFNKSFLVNFLKQTETDETAKKYWLFFENEIVNDRRNSKYNALVSKGLYVTSKQADFDSKLTANVVDFSYIMKNYSSVSDSTIKISDSEIASYYEKHKESYKRTALRDIEYVTFDVTPSEEDLKQAEDWINKTKEEWANAQDPVEFINLTADTRHVGFFLPLSDLPENLREFAKKEDMTSIFGPYMEDGSYKIARLLAAENRPDSVHVRHILLSTNQARSLEMAHHMADSLVKLIKGGAPFEVLAMTNSDDQGSSQIGGDLGWFPEGRMVVPFNNACFTGKKGDVKIAETTFGVHIIEILGQAKDSRKYNIGIVDRKVIPSSATNQRVYSAASQFAGNNDTYEKFNKAVADQGMNKRIANDVAPQQKALPGLENPRFLIMSLFKAEPGKIVLDNNDQAVFEIDDKYVVAYCTKVQEEGIAPLKDVTGDVRFAIMKDKKAEIISAEFNKYKGSNKTLDEVAQEMALPVQEATQINFRSYSVQGAGTEPALIASASAAAEGALEGPVKGVNGVFMLSANKVAPASTEDAKTLKSRLESTFEMRGMYEAYEALRKEAKIVDKRYKFY